MTSSRKTALRSGTRRRSTTRYTALSFRRVTKNTPAVVSRPNHA
jgi:hypothetical protein